MNESDEDALKGFRDRLRINKHRIDDDLEVQAETQERIGQKCNAAEAEMLRCKEALNKQEARLVQEFREAQKSTKDLAEAQAQRHPERVRAWERYQDASRDYAQWQTLLDAWKARGKDLQSLGRLFGDDYFSLTSISGSRDSRPAQDRYERPNTRRRAVAD